MKLTTKEIMEIMIDSRQRVWVAPYNNGIRCFAKDGALLASYTTRNSQLNNDVVLCMAERDGHIWIGTDGGGTLPTGTGYAGSSDR